MKAPSGYDIIGDVHGQIGKLTALLDRLGYREENGVRVPPPGRAALLLGDLIDPKPGHAISGGVREVLKLVKGMTDGGHALCLLGNHEFNAVCYHTPAGDSGWLRERTPANVHMHQGTLDDFPHHEDPQGEWHRVWIPWFKGLPMYVETEGFRAVHACWHGSDLAKLEGKSLEDISFLREAANKDTEAGGAVETVLKGIEIPLPPGAGFIDHTGKERTNFRARWWERPVAGVSCRELVFPPNAEIPEVPVPGTSAGLLQGYPGDSRPVFFGHYLKSGNSPLSPERWNVACLDHGASKGGPLVAYRWNGESRLLEEGYVTDR